MSRQRCRKVHSVQKARVWRDLSMRKLPLKAYYTSFLASASAPINGITTNTVANAALRVPYLGWQPTGLQGTGVEH